MGYFDSRHPTLLSDPVTHRDHVRGAATAEVTLVEYGDFACSSCREAHTALSGLLDRLPGVRFVFRANPRSHLFPMAPLAAEAAEAAAAQGKFWEMHDLLFENQDLLSEETILRLGRELGLDQARFEADLRGHVHRDAVHAQEISGWHSHVLTTPTFFIDGVRFDDALSALPTALAREVRRAEQAHLVFRETRVETTDEPRRVAISAGPHRFTSDLPPFEDGSDSGPSPYDLLLAALGACTAMTVKWAAEREHVPLGKVDVRLTQSRTPTGHQIRRSIVLEGDLDEAQRARLQRAADRCPVGLTLSGEIHLDTRVVVDRTVEEAGEESFPASDPPSWTSGRDPS